MARPKGKRVRIEKNTTYDRGLDNEIDVLLARKDLSYGEKLDLYTKMRRSKSFTILDTMILCLMELDICGASVEMSGKRSNWARLLFDCQKVLGGHDEIATVARFVSSLRPPTGGRPRKNS